MNHARRNYSNVHDIILAPTGVLGKLYFLAFFTL